MNVRRRSFAAGLLGCSVAASALAQAYPHRPVTIVVFSPAGSIADGVARIMAESFRRTLNQTVLVENKPGQEGAVAARAVAHANPDGYTIMVGGNSTHSGPLNLFKNLAYNPETDFDPIGGIMKIPLLLTVRAEFPAEDFRSFLRIAKDPSKALSFGSGSTSTRAAGELIKARAAIDLLHVPYRGTPQALTDLLGKRIDVVFSDPATALGMIGEGKLKALAVTSSKRVAKLPEVPTIAESGFPGFEVVPWLALFAPAKMPAEVISRLRAALDVLHKDPATLAYMGNLGVDPFPATPEQLSAFVAEDIKLWSDFVRIAGIEKS
jgi:tripartite-type tricarboxylate transporter receptor subunit TctC